VGKRRAARNCRRPEAKLVLQMQPTDPACSSTRSQSDRPLFLMVQAVKAEATRRAASAFLRRLRDKRAVPGMRAPRP